MAFQIQRVIHAISAVVSGLRTWLEDVPPARPTAASLTSGSGIVRTVNNYSEYLTAQAAAQPGDVIRIATTITGGNYGSGSPSTSSVIAWTSSDPQGTAANPITIFCDSGVWLDRQDNNATIGGNPNYTNGILLDNTDHIHIVACNVRNVGFGIRCLGARGDATTWMKTWHNEVTGCYRANLNYGTNNSAGGDNRFRIPQYFSIRYNHCHTGTSGSTNFDQEGIYIGDGNNGWNATCNNFEVIGNECNNVNGDGIDIKPGCNNFIVELNHLHDLGVIDGGGVSFAVGGPGFADQPGALGSANATIRKNWIYNLGFHSGVASSAYGIVCNIPGATIENNLIWGLNTGDLERGIFVGQYTVMTSTAAIIVRNNTVWVADNLGSGSGALVLGVSGGTTLTITWANNVGPYTDASRGMVAATNADFVGTPPSPGVEGSADAGDGVGSAFVIDAGSALVGTASGSIAADDLTSIARPQGAASEPGALELIPA